MWSKAVNRREFVEIFQAQRLNSKIGLRERSRALEEGQSEEIELLWKFEPNDSWALPNVAVIDAPKHVEFLAWISTYLPASRPITAQCRILDRWTADEMLSINRPPSLGKFVSVCLGLIAAEAASYIAGKRDIRSLSPQACYATLSFSIARAAALGIPVEIASNLPARWSHARTLTGSIATPIPLVHFHNVWGVVAALAIGYEPATGNLFNASARFPKWSPPNPFIVNCCAELLSGNGLSESSWLNLVHIAPELTTLRSALSGPREGRVALLERALVELRDKAPEARPEVRSMAASFLLAYLASAINPGSLDHIQLLIPLLPSFPDIILWYGLLAGVQNRVGNISGMNGLGRKVIRELMREDDVLSLPACDVALTELEVLSPSARQSPGFNLVSQSGITVEIMPCVNAAFRFDRHDEPISVASDELITLWKNLDDEIDRFERNLDRLRRSSLNRFIDESKSDRRTRRIKT